MAFDTGPGNRGGPLVWRPHPAPNPRTPCPTVHSLGKAPAENQVLTIGVDFCRFLSIWCRFGVNLVSIWCRFASFCRFDLTRGKTCNGVSSGRCVLPGAVPNAQTAWSTFLNLHNAAWKVVHFLWVGGGGGWVPVFSSTRTQSTLVGVFFFFTEGPQVTTYELTRPRSAKVPVCAVACATTLNDSQATSASLISCVLCRGTRFCTASTKSVRPCFHLKQTSDF